MSSRPPLAGYNHNVNYRHRRYHVQTEDSGTENPRIDTHLFHGGLIIESAKTDYSHLLDTPDAKAATKALMQNQHKGLMKKLIHGGLDEKIIALIGTLDPEEAISALVLDDEEAPEAGADVASPGEAAPGEAAPEEAESEEAESEEAESEETESEEAESDEAESDEVESEEAESDEAESDEAESEEAESEEAESDEVESEEAAPEEAESDEVAPELAAQEEAEPEEAAQEDAEPKAAQAAEAIDETDADPTQSEEAPAAMAEVIPAEEPEPIALSAFEGEETVEPVANLITTEQAEDDQIYVTGEDLYSSEELADSEEHPSVEVDSGYEDEVYTSVGGLDDLYQELDEDVSPGAGAAQGEVPQFEAGASSEEESFDFEMDPGETGEVPSVDEYIEKERQEVLTSSEYSTVDAKKDETFEVTLDTRIPPLPPEPEEDTDSVFGELSLEDEQTPPPYNRPTAEAAPDQAPDVSSGSREDWPQLDYPDDANRGRYDMDQAGADEVLSTTDFDDAYADLDPGSTADDGYVDYPPGDAYSHGLGIDTEATIDLYPDESRELEQIRASVETPDYGSGSKDIFETAKEITPISLEAPSDASDGDESAPFHLDVGKKEPSVVDSITDLAEGEDTSELEAVPDEEEPPEVRQPRPPMPQPRTGSGRVIRSRGPTRGFQRVSPDDPDGAGSRGRQDTVPMDVAEIVDRPPLPDTRPTVRQKQPPIPAAPRTGDFATPAPQTPPPLPGPVRTKRPGIDSDLNIEATLGQQGTDNRHTGPAALSYPIGKGRQSVESGPTGNQRIPTRRQVSSEDQGAPIDRVTVDTRPRTADIPRTPSGRYPISPVRGREPGEGASRPSGDHQAYRPPGPSTGSPPSSAAHRASSPQRFTAPRRRSQPGHPAVGAAPPPEGQGRGRPPGGGRNTGSWRQQPGGGPEPTMRRISPVAQQPPARPSQQAGVRMSQNVVIGQGRAKAPPPPTRRSGQTGHQRTVPQNPQAQGQDWPDEQAGSIQPPSRQPSPRRKGRPPARDSGEGGSERTLDEVILDYLHDQDPNKEK